MQDAPTSAASYRGFILPVLAVLAVLGACWVLPARLAFGEGASYYKYGFIGDEYLYAERIQPLIAGTTRTNPFNRVVDPNVYSMFFYEDTLRCVLNITGMDVFTFFWIWRVLFPVAFLGSVVLLIYECLPEKTSRSLQFCLATSSAGFIAAYVVYEFVLKFPPLDGWINRMPSNMEFPHSVLLAWALVRMCKDFSYRNGIILSLLYVAAVYLRIYTAVPWSVVIPATMVFLLIRKTFDFKVAAFTLGLTIVLLLPWAFLAYHDRRQIGHSDMWGRYFGPPHYEVHERWKFYLAVATTFLLLALGAGRKWWPFTVSVALAMASLPFISGKFPFAREILRMDRYPNFYLTVPISLVALTLIERSRTWKPGAWLPSSSVMTVLLSAVAIGGAFVVGRWNYRFDFASYTNGPYETIDEDLKFIPAYEWVRVHTPPDALFLVDDTCDWSGGTPKNRTREPWYIEDVRNDFFQIIGRRQRVYHNRLFTLPVPNGPFYSSLGLQRTTFGAPCAREDYLKLLMEWRPDYVFWRKESGVGRGMGAVLKEFIEKVPYEDEFAVVWKLKLPPAP